MVPQQSEIFFYKAELSECGKLNYQSVENRSATVLCFLGVTKQHCYRPQQQLRLKKSFTQKL